MALSTHQYLLAIVFAALAFSAGATDSEDVTGGYALPNCDPDPRWMSTANGTAFRASLTAPCRPPLRCRADGLRLPLIWQRTRVRARPLLRRGAAAARLPRVPLHLRRSDRQLQGKPARRVLERGLLPRLRRHQRVVRHRGRGGLIELRVRRRRRQLLPKLLRRVSARQPGGVPGDARRQRQRPGLPWEDAGHGERDDAGEHHGARAGAVPGERQAGGLRALPGEIGPGIAGASPGKGVRRRSVGGRCQHFPLQLLPAARHIGSHSAHGHGKRSKASEEDERSSCRCGRGRRRNRRRHRRSSFSRTEANSYQQGPSSRPACRQLATDAPS